MLKKHSTISYLLNKFGARRLAWTLRRLHVPVSKDALVLEIGSGDNPYPRSNVLLDAYEVTSERHYEPLIKDRPTVLGVAERLPFKDKAFDFIIASHVFEHSSNPDLFISELMRVGKAGYIETPDAVFERLNPYHCHRLEVTDRNGVIKIYKKASWEGDPITRQIVTPALVGTSDWSAFIKKFPERFHMRYYWQNEIRYEIMNPEVDISWGEGALPHAYIPKPKNYAKLLSAIRRLLSQHKRNASIDLLSLLRCPSCYGEVAKRAETLLCCQCRLKYPIQAGVPLLFKKQKDEHVTITNQ